MTKEPNKGGAPLGNQNAAKPVTASRKNIRLYPTDEAIIAALIAAGYEGDRSKVMRRAIREAMERVGEP